jgi:hypothetical protein
MAKVQELDRVLPGWHTGRRRGEKSQPADPFRDLDAHPATEPLHR